MFRLLVTGHMTGARGETQEKTVRPPQEGPFLENAAEVLPVEDGCCLGLLLAYDSRFPAAEIP